MKKVILMSVFVSLILASCGGENSNETSDGKKFSIKENTIILKWTAYKTTEKVGVGGEFTEVKVKNVVSADHLYKATEGLEFSIPVSSLYTNNDSRDTKLKEKFFGMMQNTELISGRVNAVEGDDTKGHGVIDLKMNNVSCDLPFDYTIENNEFKLSSVLNLLSWKAEVALDSLNQACYDLHKGADGISKTWAEVQINASVEIGEN